MSILKNPLHNKRGKACGYDLQSEQPQMRRDERNDKILAQHYSNYLEILANIKDRPRMPLPNELEGENNAKKQKRIRWFDRPLTRSSSSDHIYGVPCKKSNLHRSNMQKSEPSLCNLAANHMDSLQLQHSKDTCSKPLKCKRHRTHKLRRSASTTMIADAGNRCPDKITRNLYRNVSWRQINDISPHQHKQYQLLCPRDQRNPPHKLWKIEKSETIREEHIIHNQNTQESNNTSNQIISNNYLYCKQGAEEPQKQLAKSSSAAQSASKRFRLLFGVKKSAKGIKGNSFL